MKLNRFLEIHPNPPFSKEGVCIAGSSNGRTAAFEAVNLGSSPSPAALFGIKFAEKKKAR